MELVRVAIPTTGYQGLEDMVGQHFGRVPYYVIYNTENAGVELVENTSTHMGGTGLPAELLGQLGIDVLVCSGLGRRAIQLFENYGIMVYVGASGRVKDAIKSWEANELVPATDENACAEHAFRSKQVGKCNNRHHH